MILLGMVVIHIVFATQQPTTRRKVRQRRTVQKPVPTPTTTKATQTMAQPISPVKMPPTTTINSSQKTITKKCNDLILILDPEANETINGKSKAMMFRFIDALQEKTAPIIVTTNLVNNFCYWKIMHHQMLNTIKEYTLKNKDILSGKEKALELLQQLNESQRFDTGGLFSVLLSWADLQDHDWLCFAHKKSNLILLIPRNYIAQQSQKSTANNNDYLTQCGFDTSNLNQISNISTMTALNYIQNNPIKSPINLIDALQSMFVKQTTNDTEATTWNVFLAGHGGPAFKKSKRSMSLKDRLYNFKYLLANRKLWKSEKSETEQNSTIRSFLSQLKSLKRMPEETIVPEAAYIAGLNFNEFKKLMQFFSNDIQTSFLHYSTCFAGGYNQIFVNEMLQQLQANFIVSSQGANESSTHAWFPAILVNDNATDLYLHQNRFKEFFTLLENFFGKSDAAITKKPLEKLEQDPLATIVKTIIDTNSLDYNQPFIRIPAAGTFNALTVDKKVKILTNSIVKAHEFENNTINITDPEIEIVLMYPAYIKVPLNLKAHLSVISPTPYAITPNLQTFHIFDEIISSDSLDSLIGNFIRLNSSYSTITFVIKKLTCLDEENSGSTLDGEKLTNIHNLIIQIRGNLSSNDSIDADIDVLFTVNEKNYSFSKHITDLAHAETTFWDIFKPISATEITPSKLNALALKILRLKNITHIKERQATIPMIIKEIDKKIDTTFSVQKPGVLKNILLLQQLKSIEDAISPKQLQEQRAWLIQNKKSPLTILSTLQRHNESVVKIKDQIEQLASSGNISAEEKSVLQQRIITIQKNIVKEKTAITAKK